MVFTPNGRNIQPKKIILCNNELPWVTSAKYLGSRFTNVFDGLKSDTLEKRARFIERNCELNQEFSFAHPEVRSKLNQIYNSSFYG